MKEFTIILSFTLTFFFAAPCACQSGQKMKELKHYPINDLQGIISRSNVQFDKEISWDGNGSMRLTANEPRIFRLFEIQDLEVENAQLIYRAKLRTKNVQGKTYLEMWCHFPGKGEFFSRALHQPISGTNDWLTQQTPFFLMEGQNPDMVKLNVVIDGKGIVWIDDIHLIQGLFKK